MTTDADGDDSDDNAMDIAETFIAVPTTSALTYSSVRALYNARVCQDRSPRICGGSEGLSLERSSL
jgi:hypothetical protein